MSYFDDSPSGRLQRRWPALCDTVEKELERRRGFRQFTEPIKTASEETVAIPDSTPVSDSLRPDDAPAYRASLRPARPMIELARVTPVPAAEDSGAPTSVVRLARDFAELEDEFICRGFEGQVPGLADSDTLRAPALPGTSLATKIGELLKDEKGTFGLLVATDRQDFGKSLDKNLRDALHAGPVVRSRALKEHEMILVRIDPVSVEMHIAREARLEYRGFNSGHQMVIGMSEVLTWRAKVGAFVLRILA